jgi:hypothetical protein
MLRTVLRPSSHLHKVPTSLCFAILRHRDDERLVPLMDDHQELRYKTTCLDELHIQCITLIGTGGYGDVYKV